MKENCQKLSKLSRLFLSEGYQVNGENTSLVYENTRFFTGEYQAYVGGEIILYSEGNTIFLFQEGIKPMWEDERNKKGGRWLINLDKKQRASCLDNFWLEVVSFLYF